MKRIIVIVLVFYILLIPSAYVYAKVTWNDCMSWYITHHYPEGASYFIEWYWYHIDGRELKERAPSIHHIADVDGCIIKQGWYINTPLCYFTLLIEW